MAEVFISFIHEEQLVAEAVQRVIMEVLKAPVFISADEWQIYAGEIWLDRIKAELKGASVVLLMLSKESVSRPWINFEAGGAWLNSKAIIPVCFNGMRKDSMPKPYSAIQGLELPGDLYYLVKSVAHHLGIFSPPPFFGKSYAYRIVESALRGALFLPPMPGQSWTDDMED
jgi:TIR domain-containing protein